MAVIWHIEVALILIGHVVDAYLASSFYTEPAIPTIPPAPPSVAPRSLEPTSVRADVLATR